MVFVKWSPSRNREKDTEKILLHFWVPHEWCKDFKPRKIAYNMQCHIFQISKFLDFLAFHYHLDFLNFAFWLCPWDIHLSSSFCLPKKTFCSSTRSVSYCFVHLESFMDWVLISPRKLCRVPFTLPVTITRHICACDVVLANETHVTIWEDSLGL